MYDLEYEFEEIPLCIGKDADGRRQNVALISGKVSIDAHYTCWAVEDITLSGPLLRDPEIKINSHSPLWDYVVESIEHSCGDAIWDAVIEASRPDPDAAYDAMRDAIMERVS